MNSRPTKWIEEKVNYDENEVEKDEKKVILAKDYGMTVLIRLTLVVHSDLQSAMLPRYGVVFPALLSILRRCLPL